MAAQDGVDAVAEALIGEVAGEDAWRSFPDEIRQMLTGNGPAILAELEGEWWLQADAAALATIEQPTLLVAAADSPPEFHEPIEALADALPNARTALVGGGHLIDPAAPEVLAFISRYSRSRLAGGVCLPRPPRRAGHQPARWPATRDARSFGQAMKNTFLPRLHERLDTPQLAGVLAALGGVALITASTG